MRGWGWVEVLGLSARFGLPGLGGSTENQRSWWVRLDRDRDRVFLVWSSHECADRGKDVLVQKPDQGNVLNHCGVAVCS